MSTERNPDLEQAIAQDPDNPDGYLVYGDWLSSLGDVRGELIALQGALLRNPGDKKLRAAADKILTSKRKVLLGDLAKLKPTELSLTWQLGFIRDVRLTLDDDSKRRDALRSLITHPSGAFIRSLAIAQKRIGQPLKSADYTRILLEEKRPPTLQDLIIGSPGDFDATGDKQLVKVFPRLRKSLDKTWASLLATIDSQSRLKTKYNDKAFPAVEILPDQPGVPKISNKQLLIGLKIELDKKRNIGLITAMKRSFTVACLDGWAVAFGKEFFRLNTPSGQRWGFVAIGQLGHEKAVAWIGAGLREWTYGRAEQGVELLRQIGIDEAMYELYRLSVDDYDRRTLRAREALEHVARERSIDVEDLVDRTIPFCPSTKQQPQVRQVLERRLFHLLLCGHKLTPGNFGRYIVAHPVAAPLARRLVWGAYKEGKLEATLRIAADGVLVDAANKPVEVAGHMIGVAHPIEIPEARREQTIAAWKAAQKKAKIEPLFPQLDRPCHELTDAELKRPQLTRFDGRRVGYGQLEEVLGERGWINWHEWEEGNYFQKSFYRDDVEVLMLVGDSGKVESVELRTIAGRQTRSESLSRRRRSRKISNLHPVTLSELLWDLETATSKEVERVDATSVGSETIEKGMTVRIGSGEHRNKRGVVFWIGQDKRTGNARVGVRGKDEDPYRTNAANLVVIAQKPAKPAKPAKKATGGDGGDEAKTPAKGTAAAASKPAAAAAKKASKSTLKKGVTVDYNVRGQTGTGFVFWVGENKFGSGLRVGIKDSAGETIWANESEVTIAK